MLAEANNIAPELAGYLESIHFAVTWEKLSANAGTPEELLRQFHRWFDGFRTLKLIHYLRDHGYPEQDLFDAIIKLIEMASLQPIRYAAKDFRDNIEKQRGLLEALRISSANLRGK